MGRYYSRHGNRLYIYVTRNEPMIDLNLFPPELNLFPRDQPKNVKEKIAIVDNLDRASLDRAELILVLNGFKNRNHSIEALNHYYAVGDESVIEGNVPVPKKIAEPHREESTDFEENMEVIIPKFPNMIFTRRGDKQNGDVGEKESSEVPEEDGLPPCALSPEWMPASEEDFIKNLMECMEEKGFTYRYKPKSLGEYPIQQKDQATIPSPPMDESSNRLMTELIGLLSELLKEKRAERKEVQELFKVGKLIENLNDYLEIQKKSDKTNFTFKIKAPEYKEKTLIPTKKRFPKELVELLFSMKERKE